MSISPVQHSARTSIDGLSGGMGGSRRMRAVLDSVSQLFGMSPRALATALDSGKSMMDIASEKGISPMDLLKTIKAAMLMAEPSPDEGPVANRQLDVAAKKIAGHVGSIANYGQSGHRSAPANSTVAVTRNQVGKLL